MPLQLGGHIIGKGQGLPSSPTEFKIPLDWHHQLWPMSLPPSA